MPETSVYEYGNLLPAKDEIWFANEALFSTPARDAMRPEKLRYHQFGMLIS
jgi:hypothetical protein